MAVKVTQKEGEEVPLEILATEIIAMSEGIKKLRATRLTDDALMLLIQHAAPNRGGRWGRSPLTKKQIEAVFDGIESLEKTYLKPKPGAK